MSHRVAAIDISPRHLRAVVLETTLRKAEISSVHTVDVEGEDRAGAMVEMHRILGDVVSVVASVDGRTASTRSLRFPFGDLRKVEPAIGFELEGQVPYDIAETASAFHVVNRTSNATEVVTTLTPKKALEARLEELKAAELEPRALLLADATLSELVTPLPGECVAVASLGETTTHVAVMRHGLKAVRTLRAGGGDVDRALARVFHVEVAQAKEAKHHEARLLADGEEATPEEKRVSEAVSTGLVPLVSALSMTFKAMPQGEAPTRLVISGGLSRLPGLAKFLSVRLGMTVELLDLGVTAQVLGGRVPAIGPEYALALGMAMAVARHGSSLPLNFRRGEYAYQGDIALYRGQATRIAVGMAAVIALAIFGAVVRYSMVSGEEERIDKGFCAATQKIVGREICDPTAALATLRAAPGAGEGVVIPAYSAATMFEMISKSIGADLDVVFEELEFRADSRGGDPDRITGKGEASSFETTEQLVTALKRDRCVQDAEVSKQRKTRDGGRVEFNLTVKVSCPVGAVPGGASEVANAAEAPVPPPDMEPPP